MFPFPIPIRNGPNLDYYKYLSVTYSCMWLNWDITMLLPLSLSLSLSHDYGKMFVEAI